MQQSGKVNKFLGVYYEWGCNAKGSYAKITMENEVNNLVKDYKKYTGSDVKVQKTPGAPGTTIIKSELK